MAHESTPPEEFDTNTCPLHRRKETRHNSDAQPQPKRGWRMENRGWTRQARSRGNHGQGNQLENAFPIPLTNMPLTLIFSPKTTGRGSSRICATGTHCGAKNTRIRAYVVSSLRSLRSFAASSLGRAAPGLLRLFAATFLSSILRSSRQDERHSTENSEDPLRKWLMIRVLRESAKIRIPPLTTFAHLLYWPSYGKDRMVKWGWLGWSARESAGVRSVRRIHKLRRQRSIEH